MPLFLRDRAEFGVSLKHFLDQVCHCPSEPSWTLCTDALNQAYLHRRTVMPVTHHNHEEVQDSADPACAAVGPVTRLEHYIVYSSSYRVPVLYFEAFNTEGSPLLLEEVYDMVIPLSRHSDLRYSPVSMQGAITQAEHPHRGIPCWHIHPCQTQTLLRSTQCNITVENYIKIWLSFTGWVAGCQLTPQLFSSL